ncbi:hopanoid biosynthesis-associated protein HpnK [Microvirga alba]|uniref:Hopanoid biosynthesis-associated protein HpnK n=1 Tax=Microvirga alba TaxID=2791025 RepID=A0A931BPY3_9HYPH|nr:hopanoid biosynthesis-associated protein HpnK [Microvirga alba]MBF9235306.1 hopanoid biosynthesis-associated protein HpnK [Microvirga alba]
MSGASRVIVTADDFGMSLAVNEAVELAHRNGILTCASLMVTGDAADDAVRRARRMPGLGVGLHLTLIGGPSALGRSDIPDLLAPRARQVLHSAPWRVGTRIAFSRRVQGQVRAEISAQLDLFRKSGLVLDHVDGHWHFHQHPSILHILTQEMAVASARVPIRVPHEPVLSSWRAAGRRRFGERLLRAAAHRGLTKHMKRHLRQSNLAFNDWFFGLYDAGAMDRSCLLGIATNLPSGVTEIGMHPAVSGSPVSPFAPPAFWRPGDELAALTDSEVVAAFRDRMDTYLIRFQDLSEGAGS